MVINKEKNFISAIIYVHNNEEEIANTLNNMNNVLEANFEKYEIICVNDCSKDGSVKKIKEAAENIQGLVISVLNMSYYQGIELSMDAGVDLAIGDFVFEFDNAYMDYKAETIMNIYYHSLKGFDIVSASPKTRMKTSSMLFYKLFNSYSNNPNQLKTETFRILSRRAINRVQSMNKTIPYRKAVYSNCGLKVDTLYYEISSSDARVNVNVNERKELAIESLILFTDIAYKFTLFIALLMMIGIIGVVIYTISIFMTKQPVAGWTTMMLLLSIGLFGIFSILAIIIRYLSIIIELIFKKQKYMIESIEKITK